MSTELSRSKSETRPIEPKKNSIALAPQGGEGNGVTVILPAYNEELAVASEIQQIRNVLEKAKIEFELIVVDDGSTDNTANHALNAGARVLKHRDNLGYGASIKTGIVKASNDLIVITDADGTYPAETIPQLIAALESADMTVGARLGKDVNIPIVRRPAKWILGRLADRIAGEHIPDLNSGLRCFRRSTIIPYFPLLSDRFSFTTTSTLAFLGDNYHIEYLPINYKKRTGISKIRPWHFFEFVVLVLRMSVLFRPLRVFLPLAFAAGCLGILKLAIDLGVFFYRYSENIGAIFYTPVVSTSALLLITLAVQLGVLGLAADGIIRRIIQQNAPAPASRAVRVIDATESLPRE